MLLWIRIIGDSYYEISEIVSIYFWIENFFLSLQLGKADADKCAHDVALEMTRPFCFALIWLQYWDTFLTARANWQWSKSSKRRSTSRAVPLVNRFAPRLLRCVSGVAYRDNSSALSLNTILSIMSNRLPLDESVPIAKTRNSSLNK